MSKTLLNVLSSERQFDVRPPSMCRMVPLIILAMSLSRNTVPSATSSGSGMFNKHDNVARVLGSGMSNKHDNVARVLECPTNMTMWQGFWNVQQT